MHGSPRPASVRTDKFGPTFYERLWRSAGLQSAALFLVAAFIYGNQPPVASSSETVALFFDGDRMRVFVAAAVAGFGIVNLMWFAAAIRMDLANLGQDGWGAAATSSSAAFSEANSIPSSSSMKFFPSRMWKK